MLVAFSSLLILLDYPIQITMDVKEYDQYQTQQQPKKPKKQTASIVRCTESRSLKPLISLVML